MGVRRRQNRVATTWVNDATSARLRDTATERHVSVSAVIADILSERADRLDAMRPVNGGRGATVSCYLPKTLIAAVDRAAATAAVTRSQMIAAAIADELDTDLPSEES